MSCNLDCDIVRDLLPSYADGLTSETTNKAVREHIEGCPNCAKTLRLMSEPEAAEGETSQQTAQRQTAEVDYLKKVRRRTSRVGVICGAVMLLIGMLMIFARVFLIGSEAEATDISFNISVYGNNLSVNGSALSSTLSVARVAFEESAGIVNVRVYTSPRSFIADNTFHAEYTANNDTIGMVRCGELILWENGVQISPMTAELYAAANPFVGDMPSNSRIADIIGVAYQFGAFTNELQTTSEPYGWKLCLMAGIDGDEEKTARDIMTAESYAMLASIGNLGYVTWSYSTDAGPREFTVTAEDATAYAGKDIKMCGESPSQLQALIQSLSIKWTGVKETLQEEGAFHVVIRNNSDAEIYGYEMNYYIDGVQIGTRGGINADNTPLTHGDEFNFDFIPQDMPQETSAISLSKFSFDLYVLGADGEKTLVCENVPVSAKYGWCYFFSLADGFGVQYVLNEG